METHAFGFRLPANAPEGQKRFLISFPIIAIEMDVGRYFNLRPLAELKQCELEAVRCVGAHRSAGNRVSAMVDLGLTVRRYGRWPVLTLHEWDPATWDLPAGNAGLYVVWDEEFILRHMEKRSPPGDRAAALGPHAYWLRAHARLSPLARVFRWEILQANLAPVAGGKR